MRFLVKLHALNRVIFLRLTQRRQGRTCGTWPCAAESYRQKIHQSESRIHHKIVAFLEHFCAQIYGDDAPGQSDDVPEDAEHLVDPRRLVDALDDGVEQVVDGAGVRRPRDAVVPPLQQVKQGTGCGRQTDSRFNKLTPLAIRIG